VTPQLRIPMGADCMKAVAAAGLSLADRADLSAARERRIKDVLDRVRTVAASGMSLTSDRGTGPEPYTAVTNLLVETGLSAVEREVAVLIHIDEVQNITSEETLSPLRCVPHRSA
jgi:hypothetical protein